MKKGNTLVEAIISLAILLIAATISIQIIVITLRSINLRKEKEKANRVAYAIENEIKYNITFNEFKTIFNQGNLSLKYNENILEDLLSTSLENLEIGNNIIIQKTQDNSTEKDYEISTVKITISDSKGGLLSEREFIKSYWMDI